MKMNIEIDRESFTAWLKGKDPRVVVGISGSMCKCPVANFLNETHPKFTAGPQNSRRGCANIDEDFIDRAPVWLNEFIGAVDTAPYTENTVAAYTNGAPVVTAKLALMYLGDIAE